MTSQQDDNKQVPDLLDEVEYNYVAAFHLVYRLLTGECWREDFESLLHYLQQASETTQQRALGYLVIASRNFRKRRRASAFELITGEPDPRNPDDRATKPRIPKLYQPQVARALVRGLLHQPDAASTLESLLSDLRGRSPEERQRAIRLLLSACVQAPRQRQTAKPTQSAAEVLGVENWGRDGVASILGGGADIPEAPPDSGQTIDPEEAHLVIRDLLDHAGDSEQLARVFVRLLDQTEQQRTDSLSFLIKACFDHSDISTYAADAYEYELRQGRIPAANSPATNLRAFPSSVATQERAGAGADDDDEEDGEAPLWACVLTSHIVQAMTDEAVEEDIREIFKQFAEEAIQTASLPFSLMVIQMLPHALAALEWDLEALLRFTRDTVRRQQGARAADKGRTSTQEGSDDPQS